MKVTMLGTSAAYPGPGSACLGFLVQEEGLNLLIDCGTGVLSNLQKYVDLPDISGIIISHMHADHFFDLIPYRYALQYGLDNPEAHKPRLYLPPGGTMVLDHVVSSFAESTNFFSDVFKMSEYDPDKQLDLGHFVIKFVAVRHYIPTYALSITGSRKLTYTSDTGLCPELLQIAKGADLLLCNVGRCLGAEIDHLWGHLLPAEAGQLAKEADVKRLMITHLWPACDPAASLEQALSAFGGPVTLAEQCQTYDLHNLSSHPRR